MAILPARAFGQPVGGERLDLATGDDTHGPMTLEANYATFGDTRDPTVALGYNYGYGGNKPMANEPSMYTMVEGNYDRSHQGIPDAVMEQYWEARSADNTVQWRPIFAMADRSAANGARTTFIKSLDLFGPAQKGGATGTTGGIRFFSAKDGNSMQSDELTYMFSRGALRVEGFSDYDTTVNVRAGATKNAALMLGSQGVNNVMNIGTAAPTIGRIYVGAYTAEMTYTAVNQNKALSVGVNTYRSTAGLDVDLLNSPTAQVGLRVRQNNTTSGGNLVSVEDSTGAVKGGFDKSGYLFTQMSSAPASTDLKPGQAAFWYDATAGASKLMVTAKDSGGTVVTGAVQLSTGTTAVPQPVPDPVDGANVISAGAGNDTISGIETSDVIFGNGGDDTLSGNGGADSLYGGAGADTLYGGADADTLIGGSGNDKLIGDSGADRFSFGPGSGADLVLGFSQSEGDVLALNGQTYLTGDDGQGNLLLTLSGGGTVTLQGIAATTAPPASWFA